MFSPAPERRVVDELLAEVRACTICADLPHGPRPVLQLGGGAAIVIIGQAPGRRVHQSGIPWDDPSGERLRDWLGVDADTFYDPGRVALLPMGFCYPGTGSSGDLPPRPECAPQWHDRLLEHVQDDALRIIIGQYALRRYVGSGLSVTAAVRSWEEQLPDQIVLPHPSPRNNRWLSKNPWFERETLPALKARTRSALNT